MDESSMSDSCVRTTPSVGRLPVRLYGPCTPTAPYPTARRRCIPRQQTWTRSTQAAQAGLTNNNESSNCAYTSAYTMVEVTFATERTQTGCAEPTSKGLKGAIHQCPRVTKKRLELSCPPPRSGRGGERGVDRVVTDPFVRPRWQR